MVPIKDQYIHYDKAGDQFLGRSVTGISSLIKDFVNSPVHWYWTDSSTNLKNKMETSIEENLVRRTDVSGPNFDIFFNCVHLLPL